MFSVQLRLHCPKPLCYTNKDKVAVLKHSEYLIVVNILGHIHKARLFLFKCLEIGNVTWCNYTSSDWRGSIQDKDSIACVCECICVCIDI